MSGRQWNRHPAILWPLTVLMIPIVFCVEWVREGSIKRAWQYSAVEMIQFAKVITRKRPTLYVIGDVCPTCDGTGEINKDNPGDIWAGWLDCPDCHGGTVVTRFSDFSP